MLDGKRGVYIRWYLAHSWYCFRRRRRRMPIPINNIHFHSHGCRALFLHLLSCSVSYLCWNIQPIYLAKNVYFHIATTDFCRFHGVRAFFICSHHAQWPVESLNVMTLEQSHSCSFFSTLIWFNGWKIGLHLCLWCFMEEIFSFDGKWNWPNVFLFMSKTD